MMWLTPAGVDRFAERAGRPEILTEVRPLILRYVDQACRPLLALPPGQRSELAAPIKHSARESLGLRLEILTRTAKALTDGSELEDLATDGFRGVLREFRQRAEPLFSPEFVGCFELGIRTHVRTIRRFVQLPEEQRDPVLARAGFRLLELASYLDLCVTSVLVFLEESPSAERAAIPEELCFHVKELALLQAGELNAQLLPKEPPPVHVRLSPGDQRSDATTVEHAANELFAYL